LLKAAEATDEPALEIGRGFTKRYRRTFKALAE
jgi:hypothetical protein